MAPWGWSPESDDETQKSLNLPLIWRYPQKTQIQKFLIFLVETRISECFESVNSSLFQSAGVL